MSEKLTKKRRIRGGHKSSVTQEVGDIISAGRPAETDTKRLLHLKLSLGGKLETLNQLDEEILDLLEDDTKIGEEIEQADGL